jgi:hypothetical protein
MFSLFNHNQQIAIHPPASGCIPFARHGKLHPLLNPCWYIDLDDLFALDDPIPVTGGAFLGNDASIPPASRANGCSLHLAQEGMGNPGDLSASIAGGTG